MPRLFVLDAMNLAYRAYYALIRRPLVNTRGENTSALYGFASMTLKIRREEDPDHWALAWDGPGPTFREERFPDYKATRKPMPPDLLAQIPAIEDFAQAIGLPVLEIPGVEADDVMGSLAACAAREGWEVTLVTSDKDLFQLVNDRVSILCPTGKGEEYARVGREGVKERWGVVPEQLRDVLALMGDTSDNIPGVPGVGQKTAVDLIAAFGSLEALYDRLAEVKRDALRAKLAAHRSLAFLSRDLLTVRVDLDLPVRLDQLRRGAIRAGELAALGERWEIQRFRQVARDLGVEEDAAGERAHGRARPAAPATAPGAPPSGSRPEAPAAAEPAPVAAARELPRAPRPAPPPAAPPAAPQGSLDLFAPEEDAACAGLEARLRAAVGPATTLLALLPVTGSGPPRRAPLVGLAVAAAAGAPVYVPLAHDPGANLGRDRLAEWLGPALADPAIPKVAADAKALLHLLAGIGLPVAGEWLDLGVASFLCDPERDHGLDALARDVLGRALPPLAPPPARGQKPAAAAALPPRAVAAAAEARVAALPPIAAALRDQLEARGQWPLWEGIERPLIPVLAAMERAGIALDRGVLAAMAAEASTGIARLEAELHALAGSPVNLHSGPQLAKLLFETLKLAPGRRTKTGYSTDQATLEELAGEHPFPGKLLEYRALAKLKSTYLDALPLEVDPADGRVHTTYHQAGAATGRLSSSDPNLQNIPMRTAQGRAIRRAFVAAPGAVLIGADYSQIELRVMAHLSGDPQLREAFASGEDVHANTARRVFGVTGAIDPGLRARAKIVNFGVMYGMGARSLSQQMGIGLAEAQEFIGHYFRVYARVREFLDRTVEEARRRGYVETLLGRRRWVGAIDSPRGGERALAERIAINTPIQGSAADLMKLAMVRVHAALAHEHRGARLLLQVHDELVAESAAAGAAAVAATMKREMEGCLALEVPLVVSVGTGASWFDVH